VGLWDKKFFLLEKILDFSKKVFIFRAGLLDAEPPQGGTLNFITVFPLLTHRCFRLITIHLFYFELVNITRIEFVNVNFATLVVNGLAVPYDQLKSRQRTLCLNS